MFADWHWLELREGLIAGLWVALPAGIVVLAARRFGVALPAAWGLLVGLALYLVPDAAGGLVAELIEPRLFAPWVLGGIGILALVAGYLPAQPLLAAIAAAWTSAVMAAADPLRDLDEVGAAMVVVAPLLAIAVTYTDDRWPGLGPLLYTISLGGIYLAVPDTEIAFWLLGLVLPLMLVGLPVARLRIGGLGAAAVVAVAVWAIATGVPGRPTTAIGAFGCFGIFVVDPLARLVRADLPVRARSMPGPAWLRCLVLHGVIVGVSSRFVSIVPAPGLALAAVGALLLGGVAFAVLFPAPAPARGDAS